MRLGSGWLFRLEANRLAHISSVCSCIRFGDGIDYNRDNTPNLASAVKNPGQKIPAPITSIGVIRREQLPIHKTSSEGLTRQYWNQQGPKVSATLNLNLRLLGHLSADLQHLQEAIAHIELDGHLRSHLSLQGPEVASAASVPVMLLESGMATTTN